MSWKRSLFFLVTVHISAIFDSIFAGHLLNTSSGIYEGRIVHYNNIIVRQYLGIEYGRIPKRFDRAESIIRQNDSVINATSFGPVCKPTAGSCSGGPGMYSATSYCLVNYGIFSIKSIPAEQCLFLNVFIPVTTKTTRKKAIFMWIHGGSGQIGTGNVFDGTIFSALGDIYCCHIQFSSQSFRFLIIRR